MRPPLPVLFALLLTVLALHPAGAEAPADPAAFAARMEARLPALMRRQDVPGLAIAVLQQGRPVWTGYFGHADPASGRPVGPDTLFRVESISKPVTAWGVMTRVEAGEIGLDAPVAGALHSWRFPAGAGDTGTITLRQVLTHTAGLPIGDFTARVPADAPRPDPRAQLTAEARLIARPGAGFSYSDTGYNILEILVEDLTGRRFAAFMATAVLDPLGMGSAGFDGPADSAGALATGHDLRGRPVAPYIYPGRASGGLIARLDDIAAFATAGLGEPRVLRPQTVAAMQARQVPLAGIYRLVGDSYGLGHFTETLPSGHAAAWHGGQGHGWMSHLHLVPGTGDGIVILANSQRAWPLFARILADWGDWAGIGPPGMARLTMLVTGLWAGIALLLALAVLLWLRALAGLLRGRRRFAPLSGRARGRRAAAAGGALGLLALLGWAAMQDYLFLFSVLPQGMPWLAAALGLLAGGLALAALTPRLSPAG